MQKKHLHKFFKVYFFVRNARKVYIFNFYTMYDAFGVPTAQDIVQHQFSPVCASLSSTGSEISQQCTDRHVKSAVWNILRLEIGKWRGGGDSLPG